MAFVGTKKILFVYTVYVNFFCGIIHSTKRVHRARSSVLKPPCSGQIIRLAGGNLTSGRVEVNVHGKFGIVCDDRWDKTNADVVCKQMGFLRGATKATWESTFGSGRWRTSDILMDDVKCRAGTASLHDCDWTYPSDCTLEEVAGVVCLENAGCPRGWVAGPTGCYQVKPNKVTKREHAVRKCKARGGHLVNIETEEENNFLAHAFKQESTEPLYTGGIKIGRQWMWESVTLSNDSSRRSGRETRELVPVEFYKWFPGWQPRSVSSEPTDKKKKRCIFGSSTFHHPNGSDVNLDYMFWKNGLCRSTRKWFHSGIRYICERPRQQTRDNYGCYRGIGTEYRGFASITEDHKLCMKWTESDDTNPETYPNSGLGDHNYCRNPDSDERPWCWVSPGSFGFCDIPQCSDGGDESSTNTPNTAETTDRSCVTDEYKCSDRKCIPGLWRCDMEQDCTDGEDEDGCDYHLPKFNSYEDMLIEDDVVETYSGTTNETCAKHCLQVSNFVCRSFSFSPKTRLCKLSDKNSEMTDVNQSIGDNFFELISQLSDTCPGMFRCNNSRCVSQDFVCDKDDDCGDFSDEASCGSPSPVTIRLLGGDDLSGRVEVLYRGQWGSVCDDQWDVNDAAVVCRMLGYHGEAEALHRYRFGVGAAGFLLDNVNCTGTEATLEQCEHSGWGNHNCGPWEVAGVQCSQKQECRQDEEFQCSEDSSCISLNGVCDETCDCQGCSDEQECNIHIELADGATPSEGRIHVFFKGIQGTVCDDEFSDIDAAVVCRSLGYSSGVSAKPSTFGPGTGIIWMDDVSCVGNETDVTDCPHLGPRGENCGHEEDVGVICQDNTEEEGLQIQLELLDGPDVYSGRVELTRDGVRGTICDDDWDDDDAQVVCRMLGYSGGKAYNGGKFGPGSDDMQIFLDEVNCIGNEDKLDECRHSKWSDHNCKHSEDAGVSCNQPTSVTLSTRQSSISRRPTTETSTIAVTASTPVTPASECSDGSAYKGTLSRTENGFVCQRWTLDVPHRHKYHNDSLFPDGSMAAAENYCRNPDGDAQPWCYTANNLDERWEYCVVPQCKENCYTIASEYTGTTAVTAYGLPCQRWSSSSPHTHKYLHSTFPDGSVDAAANHCRAPDGDVTLWCYTTNSDIRWQYCNVSSCLGKFSYNATCGLRPLEATRSRRSADKLDDDDDAMDIDVSLYRKRGRVYGGKNAAYGMYPWQAGIRRRFSGYTSYHMHHCGGTIIGEFWVLSAAHCFADSNKGQVLVRTGDSNNERRDKYEQEFNVDRIYRHAQYNATTFDFDIALLKIRPTQGRGILFNDHVQPACLPKDTTPFTPGQKCLISGWGAHENDAESVFLKAARVPLIDHVTCNKLYKNTISDNMACAGYIAGGVDSCTGDSGGPLVCEIDGKYTAMGAVSFGDGCGMPNAPGVYTNVKTLLPWIRSILNGHS